MVLISSSFAAQSAPVLKAIPVKKSGASLTEGDFDATATLQVDYQ
ncbi:fimbrial protein [Salmonella enterica]|nr:fimbrial protein [Salmonella enterica]